MGTEADDFFAFLRENPDPMIYQRRVGDWVMSIIVRAFNTIVTWGRLDDLVGYNDQW
jgi:hypothetical protein